MGFVVCGTYLFLGHGVLYPQGQRGSLRAFATPWPFFIERRNPQ
jgi:hypothetical protein